MTSKLLHLVILGARRHLKSEGDELERQVKRKMKYLSMGDGVGEEIPGCWYLEKLKFYLRDFFT